MRSYWVCEKSDGVRVLLVILTNEETHEQLVHIVHIFILCGRAMQLSRYLAYRSIATTRTGALKGFTSLILSRPPFRCVIRSLTRSLSSTWTPRLARCVREQTVSVFCCNRVSGNPTSTVF